MTMDKDEVALIRVIGQRMAEARNLCGYTQKKAAQLLEIKSSMLGRFEAGINLRYIPLRVIHRASKLYDVSLDFLYGESNDFELAPEVQAERSFGTQMHEWHRAQLSDLAVKFATQQRKQKALIKSVTNVLYASAEIEEAMKQFKNTNDFNNLSCGSKLNHRIGKLSKVSAKIRLELASCNAISLKLLPENTYEQ